MEDSTTTTESTTEKQKVEDMHMEDSKNTKKVDELNAMLKRMESEGRTRAIDAATRDGMVAAVAMAKSLVKFINTAQALREAVGEIPDSYDASNDELLLDTLCDAFGQASSSVAHNAMTFISEHSEYEAGVELVNDACFIDMELSDDDE